MWAHSLPVGGPTVGSTGDAARGRVDGKAVCVPWGGHVRGRVT